MTFPQCMIRFFVEKGWRLLPIFLLNSEILWIGRVGHVKPKLFQQNNLAYRFNQLHDMLRKRRGKFSKTRALHALLFVAVYFNANIK